MFEAHSSESDKEGSNFRSIEEEMELEVIEKDEKNFFDDKLELQQQSRAKLSLVEEEKEDADESMDELTQRRKLESLQSSEVTNQNQTEETKQVYQEVGRESEAAGFASKKGAVPLH